jgi:AcrR family transcriptional regulator
MMRRERDQERRRLAILDAAERLFFAKGIHATMEEIAAEAGVAKGTLYLHFTCKEDLYLIVFARGLDLLRERFIAVASAAAGVVEKVESIGREFVRFHDEHYGYFRLIHDGSPSIIDTQVSSAALYAMHQSSSSLWSSFAEILQEGIDQGIFRADVTAFEMAIILWTNLSSQLRLFDAIKQTALWQAPPSPYAIRALDPVRLLTHSSAILLDGLRKAPEDEQAVRP